MLDFKKVHEYFLLFLPSPTEIQLNIFKQWWERISSCYQENNHADSNEIVASHISSFLKKSIVTLFFPELFLWQSPFLIPNIKEALKIIQDYYHQDKNIPIAFYADKDADGITSLTILYLFFKNQLGFTNLIPLLPEEEDSYGVTLDVANRIISHEPALLITLDCGSSNAESFAYMKKRIDTKIIIIDHHFIPPKKEDYPDVEVFMNPKINSDIFEYGQEICTSFICFKFIWAITYSFSKEYNLINKI